MCCSSMAGADHALHMSRTGSVTWQGARSSPHPDLSRHVTLCNLKGVTHHLGFRLQGCVMDPSCSGSCAKIFTHFYFFI